MHDCWYQQPNKLEGYYTKNDELREKYSDAMFVLADREHVIQVFGNFKALNTYRENYGLLAVLSEIHKLPTGQTTYSLYGDFKTCQYSSDETKIRRTDSFVRGFRERYDQTADSQYRNYISGRTREYQEIHWYS